MKGTNLGEFEEIVLLIIGALGSDAYSISIQRELKERTGRSPSIGAMHSALNRLAIKGFIRSEEGGATKVRGGRRKRFYLISATGKSALAKNHELRHGLIKLIPGIDVAI